MAPGAEIVVQSGVTLTLDKVVMFSCDQLWESIIVEDGGTLLVNNSLIEDGTRAILAEPNATVKVTNSTFSDNLVGVSTPSGSISASNNTQIELSGNTFETSSEGLKAPFKGQRGRAGIEIWNVAPLVTVESSSANAATFQNLSNGIRSINSNLLVTEASFLNINQGGDLSFNTGIFSNGSSSGARWAIINGLETGTFQNVGVGLQSLNSWNILTKYSMTEITTGADVRSSRYIAINNNVLKPSSRGIVLSQNPGTFALVQDNVVALLEDAAQGAIGMELAEPGAGSDPWRYDVENNLITLDADETTGIRLSGGKGITIQENTIELNETVQTGLELFGSLQPAVGCNRFQGAEFPPEGFTETFGLFASGSPGATYQCNLADKVEIGFQFLDMGEASRMQGNQFCESNYNLQLGFDIPGTGNNLDAVIGRQVHRGNIWLCNTPILQARNNAETRELAELSQFIVDAAENPFYLATNNWPAGVWFDDQADPAATYSCFVEGEVICEDGFGAPPAGRTPTELEVILAKGRFPAGLYQEEMEWTGQLHLYRRLATEEVSAGAGTAVDSFYQAQGPGSIFAQLVQIEALLRDAATPNTAVQGQLISLGDSIRQQADTYGTLDSLLRQAGNPTDSLALVQQKDSLRQLMNTEIALADSLAKSQAETALLKLQQARTVNNAISGSAAYIQNFKEFYDIYLDFLIADTLALTGSQQDSLLAIASQCALSGGNAVYLARSLYALADTSVTFDDVELCTVIGGREQAEQQAAHVPFRILPNPASGQITLEVEEDGLRPEQMILYDATGRAVHTYDGRLLSSQSTLPLPALPSGLYWVQVRTQDQQVFVRRLIIQQ